jgi:hypothetical protein
MLTNEIGDCMVCGRNPSADCDVSEADKLPNIS